MRKKDSSDKFYFNNPKIWESLRIHSIEKEINFLHELISSWPSKIKTLLDIGCGSGIHVDRLRKIGINSTGVDLNKSMIEFAKKKYTQSNFFVGDMKSLPLDKKYDALTCLCTTFTYNLTNKEILETLTSFNKVLNTNGLLVIDVFNPIAFFQSLKLKNSFFLEDKKFYQDNGYDLKVKHTVIEEKQIIQEEKDIYQFDPRKKIATDVTFFRLLFPMEIKNFLENCGFEVIQQYGMYYTTYTQLNNTKIITVAKKIAECIN